MNHLLVIGAGPKGLAIAAKLSVLHEMGFKVPQVHLIERYEVGAHWGGRYGYSNGRLRLGTSPEKDVGFPYDTRSLSDEDNTSINEKMRRFSWSHFLVYQGRLGDWLDRGRPQPTHREWSHYLRFVFQQLNAEVVRFHKGCVEAISLNDHFQWKLKMDQQKEIWGDGLVLTGPGGLKHEADSGSGRVFDIQNVWSHLEELGTIEKGRILVVGAGESAASVVQAVLEVGSNQLSQIDILSPSGFIYSRGESFLENQVYSNPDRARWSESQLKVRKEFISRTDVGVFSQGALHQISRSHKVAVVAGVLEKLSKAGDGVQAVYRSHGFVEDALYDAVVLATGFDAPKGLIRLMDSNALDSLTQLVGDLNQLPLHIGRGLEVERFQPHLFLPMMAGLRQGPGFSNLSSLGRLSDRVIFNGVGLKQKRRDIDEVIHTHPQSLACG